MYRPDLPPEARLSQVIPLAAERLQKALPHDPAHTVGGVLHRHGSCMTLKMLKAHAKMNSADFDLALENLQECGLVEIAPIEPLGMSARLTDAGERQLDVWRSELDEACALFASPLTREECQQLVTLLFKLVRN